MINTMKNNDLDATQLEQEDSSRASIVLDNATALAKHFIPGVNQVVKLTFIVEGKILKNYKHFELKQRVDTHHEFEASFSHDCLAVEETYQMQEAQKLLGSRLLVSIHYKNGLDKPERFFSGVITEVSFEQSHGSRGYLVIKGYSPTILLDRAPHMQSFGGDSSIPMSVIVDEILQEAYYCNDKYKASIQLFTKRNVSYACQYNETHYNFLARLAATYGLPFYYDGEILQVGNIPQEEKPLVLVYGRDVDNVKVGIHGCHVNRNLYGYNSLSNQKLSGTGSSQLEMKGSLAKAAYARSSQFLTAPSLQQARIEAVVDQDVLHVQRERIGDEGIRSFITTGTTTLPFLYPGCVVELHMLNPETRLSSYFTLLMITTIHHQVDALGKYQGYFEAVDAETGYMPRIVYTNPIVENQIATVISHADPLCKGRVQVRFDWQFSGQRTTWIRVMTPNAGSSKEVNTNRGFVFIPEEGDQVMIGFEGNHPDRPFVLGSMFHGESAGGADVNNKLKILATRSGCTIQIDDDENKGSITVKDPSGNTIYADGNSNIIVRAPETISLNARNIELQASETISQQAGKNIHLTAYENLYQQVGKSFNLIANSSSTRIITSTTINTKQYYVTSEESRIDALLKKIALTSAEEVEVKSNKKVNLY